MNQPSVLFLGGTGVISSACVVEAVARGWHVTVVNRGRTSVRPVPDGVEVRHADVHDPESLRSTLDGQHFDVVADFLTFTPDQLRPHLELFATARSAATIGQFVFISSASAYQTPPARVPVLESSPLRNPFWEYSRNKIACEDLLVAAYRADGFPATIVRPSHTYDRTLVPFDGGWTVLDRMRRGAPILVHGDGTSLWTLTHNTDFAAAFVGLLGHPAAIGDAFHITSDEALTWNQIAWSLADAAGVEPRIVHVPSDAVAAADPEWGAGLLGDKAHSMTFDNAKVKALVPGWAATVPFWRGAREIVDWYDADQSRQVVDARMNAVMDDLTGA